MCSALLLSILDTMDDLFLHLIFPSLPPLLPTPTTIQASVYMVKAEEAQALVDCTTLSIRQQAVTATLAKV